MTNYSKKAKEYSLKVTKSDFKTVKIMSSQDSYDYIKQFYFDDLEIYESFYLCLLNNQNVVEGYVKISQGGTAGTVVDVKIVAKYAIDSLASCVIIAHNHPSGGLEPSASDKAITQKIKTALKMFDISLLDHIILTSESYFSFADNYLLI
jgi:DNA repair protein RadC